MVHYDLSVIVCIIISLSQWNIILPLSMREGQKKNRKRDTSSYLGKSLMPSHKVSRTLSAPLKMRGEGLSITSASMLRVKTVVSYMLTIPNMAVPTFALQ